jgi:hypothetical protein
MDELVSQAIELLPVTGTVEFNAYKATLYEALPDYGRDVFASMIKRGLVKKELGRDSSGAVVVLLSRLSMPLSSVVGKGSKK